MKITNKVIKDFRDIYKLPLKASYGRVNDINGNFVFQFINDCDSEIKETPSHKQFLDAINGISPLKGYRAYVHLNGYIIDDMDQSKIILIRGWGNLTGIGAHNLPAEVACNIQDTFAEFIVEQLNKGGRP